METGRHPDPRYWPEQTTLTESKPAVRFRNASEAPGLCRFDYEAERRPARFKAKLDRLLSRFAGPTQLAFEHGDDEEEAAD